MADQYLRYWSLIVADDSGSGIDLSALEINFVIHHGSYTFPHTADIHIANLAPQTQQALAKEFTKIQLMAGYQGNYGIIFQGAIKQVRVGRESATDGFTLIHAADGDQLHNFGSINTSLPAGYTQEQVWAAISTAAASYNSTAPLASPLQNQNRAPRGKVMYGQLRDTMRDWADTNGHLVTVDNGILTAMPLLAYKEGDAIQINASTGMVGSPEQTEGGIAVTCLLNPAVAWGSRIQLNNSDITQNLVSMHEATARQGSLTSIEANRQLPGQFQSLSTDGFYKVLSVDHVGETRGNPWYTQIIALVIDPTSAVEPDVRLPVNLLPPES